MRMPISLPSLLALTLAAAGASSQLSAQQYAQPAGPAAAQPPAYAANVPPPPPGGYAPVGPVTPDMFASLSDQPSRHAGFVFDRSMMQAAQDYLIDSGIDAKRAAAAITGLTIDNWHFKSPAFYPPENLSALATMYKAAGWMHLVNQDRRPNSADPVKPLTDLWLHHQGANIDAVTVLTRGPRNMTVLQLTGDLRPVELMHLGGHFGIPKVDPNTVMVPAP
jgi:hypothetical protein